MNWVGTMWTQLKRAYGLVGFVVMLVGSVEGFAGNYPRGTFDLLLGYIIYKLNTEDDDGKEEQAGTE